MYYTKRFEFSLELLREPGNFHRVRLTQSHSSRFLIFPIFCLLSLKYAISSRPFVIVLYQRRMMFHNIRET